MMITKIKTKAPESNKTLKHDFHAFSKLTKFSKLLSCSLPSQSILFGKSWKISMSNIFQSSVNKPVFGVIQLIKRKIQINFNPTSSFFIQFLPLKRVIWIENVSELHTYFVLFQLFLKNLQKITDKLVFKITKKTIKNRI